MFGRIRNFWATNTRWSKSDIRRFQKSFDSIRRKKYSLKAMGALLRSLFSDYAFWGLSLYFVTLSMVLANSWIWRIVISVFLILVEIVCVYFFVPDGTVSEKKKKIWRGKPFLHIGFPILALCFILFFEDKYGPLPDLFIRCATVIGTILVGTDFYEGQQNLSPKRKINMSHIFFLIFVILALTLFRVFELNRH